MCVVTWNEAVCLRDAIEEAEEPAKERFIDLIVDPLPTRQEDGSMLDARRPEGWGADDGKERKLDFIAKGYKTVWVAPLAKGKEIKIRSPIIPEKVLEMKGPVFAVIPTQETTRTLRMKVPVQYVENEKQWEK